MNLCNKYLNKESTAEKFRDRYNRNKLHDQLTNYGNFPAIDWQNSRFFAGTNSENSRFFAVTD